ncbi:glutathione S-transferase D7 isoform X1 [Eupeodes corollae]|uniref:glutathione S-transferase D7 isoform X1 n=2 Tax=Eupeodes corollae TaxID=290404 RepID=UPI0024930CAC|nr:glutathione S-transferase D7 isoform X1 [Eupeodes corollae]
MVNETREIVKEFVYCLIRGGKMPPILYYLPPSPPCRAIMMLAKMLDMEFDMRVVNIMEGEQLKPEFVELNPQHCLPTVDDDGLVLWESRAILSYLVSAYAKDDKLYPKDIRVRALVDQRLQFDLGTLYARMGDYFFATMFMGAPLDETKKAKLLEALRWFEAMFKNKQEFSAADHFTIADLSLTITVSQMEAFGLDLGPYPKIRGWLKKCKEELEPYGYEEINQSGADALKEMLHSKMQK